METRYIIAGAISAVAAFALGLWWPQPTSEPGTAAPPATQPERRVLYWYDPMRPDQRFDAPGPSPFMDMDLVPRYADEGTSPVPGKAVITIAPQVAQNLGVRTAVVRAGTYTPQLSAVGAIAIDETRLATVEARAEGWVEQLLVRAAGEWVQKAQPLAAVHAPALQAARQELALAERTGDAALIAAARQRTSSLGLDAAATATGHLDTVRAPVSGVVTELLVRDGARVEPGMPLLRLADLSTVWMLIEVPEAQAAWLRAGLDATAEVAALPQRRFSGRLDYVYPVLDGATRTVRARLAIENTDGHLKPGMFARAMVSGAAEEGVLLMPAAALIRTGTRSVVLRAEAAGQFQPVAVTSGTETGDDVVIVAGLQAGDRVVVSGQFLIDSEANLQGALDRLSAPSPAGSEKAP